MTTTLIRSSSIAEDAIPKAGKALRVLILFPSEARGMRAMYTYQKQIGYKPPLGPLTLATYLRAHSAHEVQVLDLQAMDMDEADLRRAVEDFQPDVVGISAWTNFWYEAWRCIQVVKAVSAEIHVCVGGPHVSIFPEITLEHSGCDSVVVGDGEGPFLWLVDGLSSGKPPAGLPGLHLKGDGVKQGELRTHTHGDLDALGFPDRRLLPIDLYWSPVSKHDHITTMLTSRGCPYTCTFCKLEFQKPLFRSAESVLAEMEDIASLGIKEIEIYDDTFTWSHSRLIEICKGMVERKLDLRWAIRDRVSSPSPETMEWLAKAGCSRIQFGVEAGTQKALDAIQKGTTLDQVRNAVRLAKAQNIEVLTYFMLGMPGETREDIEETIRFCTSLDPDYATFSVTVPYAGTEIYRQGLESGVIPEDHWTTFAERPTADYIVPYFWEAELSKAELIEMRDKAVRRFHFRLGYILKQVSRSSSPGEIYRKGRMAIGLAKHSLLGMERGKYTQGAPQ